MDFLVNDLSLAGQFNDMPSFANAVGRIMEIRWEIQRLGSALYCHRRLAYAQITAQTVMQQVVQGLPDPQRRALMQWLTQHGPYWEDARQHLVDDWVEVNGDIVTDTAVGEAAVCRLNGLARELVSFDPSAWTFTPVPAVRLRDNGQAEQADIPNHWEIGSVRESLAANPATIDSWVSLDAQMRRACSQLIFADNAFEPLDGHPFVPGAAVRIRGLLYVLDSFKGCFDNEGRRNQEGHWLYANHFTGAKAWFSDSSDSEKNDFRNELTFPHPQRRGEALFCTWHGKVKTPQIRIHFSWPVQSDAPLYVVYVGPKLTKQ